MKKLIRHLPRFVEADRALATLAGRETWTREQIDAFQLNSINALWKHAVESVPYYRRLHRERNLPLRFDDLSHFHQSVPVLSKASVREAPASFRSSVKRPGFGCRTGGSTGMPMKVYWDRAAHREMLQSKYRAFQMWNVDYLDRIAFLWGHSTYFQPGLKGRAARLRQPLEDFLRNRLRLSAYHLGPADLQGYLRKLRRFRPVAMYGYPTAMRLLAEQARRESFQLSSLRLIVLTGEPIDPPVAAAVENAFGAAVATEYGCVDGGHIAHSWPDGSLRVREDVMHLETHPQGESEHAVIVTPLHNVAFPLIRYDLEDISSQPVKFPSHGFAKLHNVVGRQNDFLITSGGGIVHASRMDAMFRYQCTGIRRFHVHQKLDGAIDVFVELHQLVPETEKQIESLLFALAGYPVAVRVVEEMRQTSAGKQRILVSDLATAKLGRRARH